MAKFNNKYRIESHRKPNWDYSASRFYFLTFNTKNHAHLLGKIMDSSMILSDFGKIVETEWHKSFEIRDELILHEFIIMPNHLHTIVEISNPWKSGEKSSAESHVQTHGRASLRGNHSNPGNHSDFGNHSNSGNHSNPEINPDSLPIKRNPPIRQPKSISSFLAGFKSAVNTKIDDYIDEHNLPIPKYNRNNHFFQPNYHDHIIRNNREYQNIANYIRNNPAKWAQDKFRK